MSDNVSPSINENIFEQKVLFTLEKLLGWSQFKGEIKVRPSLQIGRQNFITPDIVLYTPDNKAVIVLEIKRPVEDLGRPGTFGQLQSYMRQTKADFGFLVGKEIRVYYDGILSPNADPLLLSKIRFKSDSAEGTDFVELFNRDSFIAGKYESYLKAHIDRLQQERKIDAVRERLQSEETSQRLLKLLQHDITDVETQILMEAMKGLIIKVSYGKTLQNIRSVSLGIAISNKRQDFIFVCKNKASGKYFIYIEDLKDDHIRLINPDGGQIDLNADLFEEPKDETVDYLLSYKLINETQLGKYHQYVSSQPEDHDTAVDHNSDKAKTTKRLPSNGSTMGRKNRSPSAYEWSRGVPELSRISGRATWRAICDYLKVYVGADSARRALKDWARENRRGWPPIPEPLSRGKGT
ncbi:MAG: type I restriction enzyme HsdR N-terminal domain-containing protein [Proteobacteria bacterium]|nr:type I restriction enzyme HsdR N-terminal domain-containing protein [Pseudomonadota bacterium]